MSWRVFKKDAGRRKWTVAFTDHLGARRRIQAFRDRALSEELGRSLCRVVEHRSQRAPLPPMLATWVQGLAPELRDRLAAIGLLDSHTRPLAEHVTDYAASLEAKGNTPKHVKTATVRISRILEAVRIVYWSDMQASKVQRCIGGLRTGDRPATPETKNHYLGAIKGFCRWAVRDGRLPQSPLEHLRKIEARKVRSSRRHERRALTVEEVRRLLESTVDAPDVLGMTGGERALLYRLAVETGLRVSELASLTRASFELHDDCPVVTVDSAYTKNHEPAEIPLRAETAAVLLTVLAGKTPRAPAFNVPDNTRTATMIRQDLERAGIPYRVGKQVADFHALRHTCGSWLAAAGVHPKVIQAVMRHSTITLTMDRYTHLFKGDEAAAVGQLPDLSPAAGEVTAATGTDGPPPDKPVPSRGAQRGATGGLNASAPWTHMDSRRPEGGPPRSAQVPGKPEDLTASTRLRTIDHPSGPVAESADAADLKSAEPQGSSGFESRRGHWASARHTKSTPQRPLRHACSHYVAPRSRYARVASTVWAARRYCCTVSTAPRVISDISSTTSKKRAPRASQPPAVSGPVAVVPKATP